MTRQAITIAMVIGATMGTITLTTRSSSTSFTVGETFELICRKSPNLISNIVWEASGLTGSQSICLWAMDLCTPTSSPDGRYVFSSDIANLEFRMTVSNAIESDSRTYTCKDSTHDDTLAIQVSEPCVDGLTTEEIIGIVVCAIGAFGEVVAFIAMNVRKNVKKIITGEWDKLKMEENVGFAIWFIFGIGEVVGASVMICQITKDHCKDGRVKDENICLAVSILEVGVTVIMLIFPFVEDWRQCCKIVSAFIGGVITGCLCSLFIDSNPRQGNGSDSGQSDSNPRQGDGSDSGQSDSNPRQGNGSDSGQSDSTSDDNHPPGRQPARPVEPITHATTSW